MAGFRLRASWFRLRAATTLALALASPALALAQVAPAVRPPRQHPVGRISFYTSAIRIAPDNASPLASADLITAVQVAVPDADANMLEYGVDFRQTRTVGTSRPDRLSMYDGYVGVRLAHGRVRTRVGQMWLPDLGGLGAVAGVHTEVSQRFGDGGSRLRVGGFGGVEPDPFGLGHADRVRKFGVYTTLEAPGGRRHSAGYVRIAQGGLVERSVLTTSHFLRAGRRVFVYQMAEYDLVGPAGQGKGRLTYLLGNAHASITDALEVQALYHRGRSLDARAITDDVLNSRPLKPDALSGLLFESAGARVVFRVHPDVRLNAGYTRDRNNMDSAATRRLTGGGSVTNLGHTGMDVTLTASQLTRPAGQYTSIYISAGRQLGSPLYLTADYSSAVSIARFTRSDGVVVETRPHTRQLSVSAMMTLSRGLSALVTLDRTRDDDVTDLRVLSGLTVRLR